MKTRKTRTLAVMMALACSVTAETQAAKGILQIQETVNLTMPRPGIPLS